MKLRVGAASDVGRARERNEDAYLARAPLYAVADGMGGHRGGDVASQLAVEVLSGVGKTDADGLAERVRQANKAILDRATEDRSLTGMGTTVTAVLLSGRELHLAHVGDSRAYLLRDGKLRTETEDHSLVQRWVREGRISEEEAKEHPQRSILTRALGVDDPVDVDMHTFEVQEGDRILLCSDGLYSMVRDETIKEALERDPDPQRAAESLVDLANRAGGLDNITVVILSFEQGEGVEVPAAASEDGDERAPSAERALAARGTPDITRPEDTGFIATPKPRPREEAVPARARRGRTARTLRRVLIWGLAALLLLVAAFVGFRVYLDTQWYVGVNRGHVAIYRGIPEQIGSFHLSSLVEKTTYQAGKAESAAPRWRQIEAGITAGSKDEARSIVDQISKDIAAARSGGAP